MKKDTDKETNKKESELELEIAQLKFRIRERDRAIFELEEEIRGRDAIILDRCQLIERLEKCHYEQSPSDQDSWEKTSISTVQCLDVKEDPILNTEQQAQLLEELEQEREKRIKLIKQNELLMHQWDNALIYAEQVQKKLQAELRRTSTLIDENAMLRKRINETVLISKSGIQFVAFLLALLSLYLYTYM
ncbi:unnamed protein product [Thelazia callipaeda]|uniref:Coiled-coil domain-containing protein 167 n=1 Tax=Thelazia callipaeda TaxID=103827 RepID=A0A0N5CP57_THECL|nr:unnamed protein product [Thelazia callipaeda]